ncbi:MAG: hypothetical protein Q7S61_02120 [bacterium]|nr:hypothetical protein [bacterium]
MKTKLEIFFTKIVDDRVDYWKKEIDITYARHDPDDLVLELITNKFHEPPDMVSQDYLIHSTSWRYTTDTTVILTYIVYSDHIDFGNRKVSSIPLHSLMLAHSSNIKKPRPIEITDENVVSHGMRHLGFLTRTDKRHMYSQIMKPHTLSSLRRIFINLAGRIDV